MKTLIGVVLIFVLVGIGFWFYNHNSTGKIQLFYETAEQIQKREDAKFGETLRTNLLSQTGEYAVWVMRLTTGESYGFNEQATMPARSAIKVPIILTTFRLGLSDKYDLLLERMGKYSDNGASIKMEKNLGKAQIEKTMDELNMINTDYDQNTTTAIDLATMWKFIYEDSQKDDIFKYLTNSIYEDRIAKGIPKDAKLVHKVGTDVDVWNDSGIIFGSRPFILVILNQGVKREEAEKTIPEITRQVWDYEVSVGNTLNK